MATPSEAHRKKGFTTLIILLAFEAVYIAVELGFNASLLNASSGSLGPTADIDYLVSKGKQLSGIGLGLLITGWLVTRKNSAIGIRKSILIGAMVFPASIYAMTTFQTWLINDALIESASDDRLLAAHYLQYATPAIREGVVQIQNVPISPEDLPRPETKALLTLLGPTLLHNEKVTNSIAAASQELIKNRAHKEAIETASDLFKTYQKHLGEETFDELFDAYKIAGYKMMVERDREINDINWWRRKHNNVNEKIKFQWGRYKRHHKAKANGYTRTDAHNIVQTPGLSEREVYAHPKALKAALNIDDPELLAQITPADFSYERLRTGPTVMRAKPLFRKMVRYEVNKKFQKAITDEILEKTGFDSRNYEIKPDLSRKAFQKARLVKALENHLSKTIAQELNMASDKGVSLRASMSQAQFTNEFLIPLAWAKADRVFRDLPKTSDVLDRGIRADTQPLKALYVPAIAITFSLIFSLLTLAKITGRIWTIAAWSRNISDKTHSLIGITIKVSGVIAIIALPLTLGSNSLAQTKIIEAAGGKDSTNLTAKLLRWTLDVEPVLFPLGNAIAKDLDIPGLRLSQFHDSSAKDRDTKGSRSQISTVSLLTPLPVKKLQKTLKGRGYNPGPADGIFGPSTTEAIRAFQKDNSLEVTGTQDQPTINQLRTP